MKRIVILSISLLTLINTTYAVLVKVADEKVLVERLNELCLEHFMEKTKLIKQLAGQEKEALGVQMAVELSLYDYDQYMKNRMVAIRMQMTKPLIIKAILQEHPSAIQELKDHGLLKD